MADRNVFSPKTRQFSEREITRLQTNFSDGMIRDITNISDKAVADLQNVTNYGDYLEGRGGTRLWGDYGTFTASATLPALTGRTGYSITKSGTTVTKTTGTTFTSADIGNYIVYDDGKHERIIAVPTNSTVTVDTSTAHAASTAAWMRAQINGLFFHKTLNKVILHIGEEVYVASSLAIPSWTKYYCVSYDTPANAISTFDEFENTGFLFTSNGIFKIDFDSSSNVYYKINTPNPSVKLTDSGAESSTITYGYNYVYTMSRLSGDGIRDRTTEGVKIEQESGSNVYNSDLIDYGAYWKISPVITGITIADLTCPVDSVDPSKKQSHWTHYSIYRTKDIGNAGDAISNSPVVYIWVADVAICKSFFASANGQPQNTITATSGIFEPSDTNSVFTFADGSTGTLTYVSSTTAIWSGNGIKAGQAGVIGAGLGYVASQSTTQVTSTTSAFSSTDVGKTIFWSDGTRSYISGYTSDQVVTVLDSTTRDSLAFVITPTSRKYYDTTIDETMQGRLEAGFSLQQRFWEPLPACNIGTLAPGFMIVAEQNNGYVWYSQMPLSMTYITGYYYSPYQWMYLKDEIQAITEHTDKVVVWCKRSRHSLPVNLTQDYVLDKVGISYTVLGGSAPIDQSVGILDRGALCYLDNGNIFFISNEPSIRIFDGEKDINVDGVTDFSQDKIKNDLRLMQHAYNCAYHPELGVIFWGIV